MLHGATGQDYTTSWCCAHLGSNVWVLYGWVETCSLGSFVCAYIGSGSRVSCASVAVSRTRVTLCKCTFVSTTWRYVAVTFFSFLYVSVQGVRNLYCVDYSVVSTGNGEANYCWGTIFMGGVVHYATTRVGGRGAKVLLLSNWGQWENTVNARNGTYCVSVTYLDNDFGVFSGQYLYIGDR